MRKTWGTRFTVTRSVIWLLKIPVESQLHSKRFDVLHRGVTTPPCTVSAKQAHPECPF